MEYKTARQKSSSSLKNRLMKLLVDEVIEQMKLEIDMNDWTAIESLLFNVSAELLEEYLPQYIGLGPKKEQQEEHDG
jgi:hypothetical protein|tara:strand:- start:95 stop:325 length:231 start_codon:yes stop_codon:yes gene_type:complete